MSPRCPRIRQQTRRSVQPSWLLTRSKELYELYIRRHDRINNWDLVDLAAYYVVGKYLADKPRDILYNLARSQNLWERRSAIVATAHFILKLKETDDTFKIAEILVNDPEDLVNKGTGWMLRSAGDIDHPRLLGFLDRYAATMPRILLRYSIEKLDLAPTKVLSDLKKCRLNPNSSEPAKKTRLEMLLYVTIHTRAKKNLILISRHAIYVQLATNRSGSTLQKHTILKGEILCFGLSFLYFWFFGLSDSASPARPSEILSTYCS